MSIPESAYGGMPNCPHCGSRRIQRHGTFSLKDGSRHQRFLCKACNITSHAYTGTALNYLKKRDRWDRFVNCTIDRCSLRQMAAMLGVQVSTAFSWRHRLLAALTYDSQPVLNGCVAASEAYVRYSEKGNRCSDGRGAHGIRKAPRRIVPGKRRFRRLIDGKPTCVLVASANDRNVVVIVGRGRPAPERLQASLAPVLGDVAELWGYGTAPFAEACRCLGVRHRDTQVAWASVDPMHPCRAADRLRSQLHGWLAGFYGVATRYLDNYLAWYRCAGGPARERSVVAFFQLLMAASTWRLPVRVA